MFDGDEKEGKLVGQVDTFIAAILARRGTFDLFCTSFSHIINEHKIATAQLKICHKRTIDLIGKIVVMDDVKSLEEVRKVVTQAVSDLYNSNPILSLSSIERETTQSVRQVVKKKLDSHDTIHFPKKRLKSTNVTDDDTKRSNEIKKEISKCAEKEHSSAYASPFTSKTTGINSYYRDSSIMLDVTFEEMEESGHIIVQKAGDGNCFYTSVTHNLDIGENELRAQFCDFIEKHPHHFADAILGTYQCSVSSHLEQHRQSGDYVEHFNTVAAASVLQRHIFIYRYGKPADSSNLNVIL
uniref:OTU domain-containing protein n=1 Tax=Panagrolaimus sp. ES5 TaxID=591445 RepID=A0AC34FZX8_9BILA